MADLKTLNKLIKTMRKQGVLTLEHDGFKLSIAHEFLKQPKHPVHTEEESPKPFTEEDALFWSSAGLADTTEANQ